MADETTQLVLAAANGDRNAFATLVARYQPDVWRLCAHLVDRDSADDLTQDTFLRAGSSLAGFRGDASARTWLLAIARAACADEIRRRQRRRALQTRLNSRRTASAIAPDTGSVDLHTLLDGLNEDRRLAFVLTQILGLRYGEAAKVCGCNVGTIRSRVARGRAELVAAIELDDVRDVGN